MARWQEPSEYNDDQSAGSYSANQLIAAAMQDRLEQRIVACQKNASTARVKIVCDCQVGSLYAKQGQTDAEADAGQNYPCEPGSGLS